MSIQARRRPFVMRDVDLPGIAAGDPDVSYTIQPLPLGRQLTIRNAVSEKRFNPLTHQEETISDPFTVVNALFQAALQDWSGWVDDDGQPAPCTEEWKDAVDGDRRAAIVNVATNNRVVPGLEGRAESFPAAPVPADVVG